MSWIGGRIHAFTAVGCRLQFHHGLDASRQQVHYGDLLQLIDARRSDSHTDEKLLTDFDARDDVAFGINEFAEHFNALTHRCGSVSIETRFVRYEVRGKRSIFAELNFRRAFGNIDLWH